jgi:hypothetical protein
VSIVRVGLAETKGFSEGHDAIFGKRKASAKKKAPVKKAKPAAKASAAKGKKKSKNK